MATNQIHDRYYVQHPAEYIGLVATAMSFSEAMTIASEYAKRHTIDESEIQIYDTMARFGCAETWKFENNGWVIETRRRREML